MSHDYGHEKALFPQHLYQADDPEEYVLAVPCLMILFSSIINITSVADASHKESLISAVNINEQPVITYS